LVTLDQLVHKVQLDLPGLRDQQGLKVLLVTRDQLAQLVQRATLAQPAQQALLVTRDQLAQLVQLDLLAWKALLDHKAQLDLREPLDQLVLKA
jgi:hypothetical protein